MKRARSYGGNECPVNSDHGPMLEYPGSIFVCPHHAHVVSASQDDGVFAKFEDGWKYQARGRWIAVPLADSAKETGNAVAG